MSNVVSRPLITHILVLTLWAGVPFSIWAAGELTHGDGADSSSGNIPPSVAITAPVSQTLYCLDATIHIRAAATDPDGSIAQVQFFIGTTNLVGTITNPPYSLTLSNIGPNSFSRHYGDPLVLTSIATDDLAASTTSTPIYVYQSQGLPCEAFLYIVSPTNNSVFNSPATFAVNVLLQSDFGGTGPVQLYAGTNLLGTMPATDDTFTPTNNPTAVDGLNLLAGVWSSFTFTVSNLPPGNYNLTATAQSFGSPPSGVSEPINITVLPANIPPIVSLVSLPTNNLEFTLPANIRLEASASDRDGTIRGVQFLYTTQTTPTSTTTTAFSPFLMSSPFVFVATNVTSLAGYGRFIAIAIDDGGASRTSAPVYISATTGAQSPVVHLSAPTNGAIFTSSTPMRAEAELWISDNNVNPIEFYVGTNLVGSVLDPPYRISLSNLMDGTYSISAGIRDLAGNLSPAAQSTFTVTTLLVSTPGFRGDGQLPLLVTGAVPGATVVLQRSTNLVDWVGFQTNVATTSIVNLVDSAAGDGPVRFYRCVLTR